MRAAPLRNPIRRALASDRRARPMTWMDHRRRRPARRCARATPASAPDRRAADRCARSIRRKAGRRRTRRRHIGSTTCPGECPGKCVTSNDNEPSVSTSPSDKRSVGRLGLLERNAVHRRLLRAARDRAEGPPDACAPGRTTRAARRQCRRCDRDGRGSARWRRASRPTRRIISMQFVGFVARIDQRGALRRFVDDEIRVLAERTDRPRIDDHAV